MIKHIVMFRLKPLSNAEEKIEKLNYIKSKLDKLPGFITEIKAFETGINISKSPSAYDLVLVSAFGNAEDLDVYRQHPKHQEVVGLLNEMMDVITVVDYQN